MRILLGLTGSVATVLYRKLICGLQQLGAVDLILTESATHFVDLQDLRKSLGPTGRLYRDHDEWTWDGQRTRYRKGDEVLHIELRNAASALVIAPLSANTLAKLAGGICDNLLTSVARAWDLNRPMVLAPAMNTVMWEHPLTARHIQELQTFGYAIVPPQAKLLACGTAGMGAMAEVDGILQTVRERLRWSFPLRDRCSGIPTGSHPGAYGARRKHDIHTGVDLYTYEGAPVHAVEPGRVIAFGPFTGPQDNSPWWNNTECVLIEGASGVVCYGETSPEAALKLGDRVAMGQLLGHVQRVLPDGKERPDIAGHSTSMLHLELYSHGQYAPAPSFEGGREHLQDPTPWLLQARGSNRNLLH